MHNELEDTKVVILAGGYGTRMGLSDIDSRPKPMLEIGRKPILWHIMKIYSSYGVRNFVLALGFKGNVIRDWFLNYCHYVNDTTINLRRNEITINDQQIDEDWTINLVDTGLNTQIGGRIKRVEKYLEDTFMVTYGDGVADINIKDLYETHKRNFSKYKIVGTVTAVKPPARYGELILNENLVTTFEEKPQVTESWINGGFFVLESSVLDYIEGDKTIFERESLPKIASENKLGYYLHHGFWRGMDTPRDLRESNEEWDLNKARWKTW